MDGNIMKKLEEMGRIKIIQKPKYKHESSKDEYLSIQNDVSESLDIIINGLKLHQNSVKKHITNIGIEGIKNAFNFYFNLRTNAENSEFNRRFLKNYNEIKNIVMRTPGPTEDEKAKMLERLEEIKQKFVAQLNYIKNLEEDIASGKIKPSKNPIEIIRLR